MALAIRNLTSLGHALFLVGVATVGIGDAWALTGDMVSRRSDGSPPSSIGITDYMPAVTPDGRYVAFMASATDLVSPDASGSQIYLRDRILGTTELISVDNAGNPGNNSSVVSPGISSDGCRVVYSSYSTNFVTGDTNGGPDVFVRNRCPGLPSTSAVSVNSGGLLGNGGSDQARISANGRYVVFASRATNLVPPHGTSTGDTLYVRDLQTGTTSVLGTYVDGSVTRAIAGSDPDISADGMQVVFWAYDRPESPALWQIYRYDRNASAISLVSTDAAGTPQALTGGISTHHVPAISGDGAWAAFASTSGTLVPGVGDGLRHVYVKNLTTGAIHVADRSTAGALGNGNSSGGGQGERPAISYDGTWVAFSTSSTNLFPGAPFQSVILHNIHTGETTGLTAASTSALPAISSDSGGRFVSFFSSAFLDPRFSSRGYFLIDRQANPLFTIPTPGSGDVGFLRFYNSGSTSGTVVGTLYDQTGATLGTPGTVLSSALAAKAVLVLSSTDVATAFGVTSWTGRAWMEVSFVPAGRRIACAEPHSLHGADQHELRFGPLCAEHPGGRQHRPGLCQAL